MSFSDSYLPHVLSRRNVLGLAGAAASVPLLGAAVADPSYALPERTGRLHLHRDPGSVVSALDVPVTPVSGRARPGHPLRTAVLHTTAFSMLGVTWRAGTGTVRFRARAVGGGWSDWQPLPALHDLPDTGTAEALAMPHATQARWVGPSHAVQLELSGDLQHPVLTLIDPGRHTGDQVAVPEDDRPLDARTSTRNVPRPEMLFRRAWHPNPKLRSGSPVFIKTVKQVHVHHTVSTNHYSRSDVPAMIRGMYRYHTVNLGWSDIGYNFLVDRFGRIWVGRAHSSDRDRLVRGAHTLGFNHNSVGVSVIGNFETARPNGDITAAIARVAAWRLSQFDRDPLGKIWVWSKGSDRFPSGRRVRLPVIDGHRDTNETACPGRYLYAALPEIRRRTAKRIHRLT